MIVNHRVSSYKLRRRESVAIADIIQRFNEKLDFIEI